MKEITGQNFRDKIEKQLSKQKTASKIAADFATELLRQPEMQKLLSNELNKVLQDNLDNTMINADGEYSNGFDVDLDLIVMRLQDDSGEYPEYVPGYTNVLNSSSIKNVLVKAAGMPTISYLNAYGSGSLPGGFYKSDATGKEKLAIQDNLFNAYVKAAVAYLKQELRQRGFTVAKAKDNDGPDADVAYVSWERYSNIERKI